MSSIDSGVRPTPLFALLLAATVLACGEDAPPMARPPQPVVVEVVDTATVTESFDFVGTVQPFRRVEVRSPIEGIITARPFEEGALVHRGDVLYEIDKTVYRAAASSADARLKSAQRQVDRLTPLLAEHAIAERDLEVARTELLQAQAGYDQAAKSLSDATVRAEITGRVGQTAIELGGRVTGAEDLLTTIDQVDPMYVSFRPSSSQLLEWSGSEQASKLIRAGSDLDITLTLSDGSTLGRSGRLAYIDPALEPGTGTREFRAKFSNPDRDLIAGQFVRVSLGGFRLPGAITVPQRAVQQQMGRQVVYVVGPGDTVAVRQVEVGQWVGKRWIIESGLQIGDRVVVDGFQKTGPGAVVAPSVATRDSTGSVAAPEAGDSTP